MLLGLSVSKSMLALCVPNHINYLSGCRDPPLGIGCTSLSLSIQAVSQSAWPGRCDIQWPIVELESDDGLAISSSPVFCPEASGQP